MYNQDTFFHLSMSGRIGLVLLSIMIGGMLIALHWWLTRQLRIRFKILLALVFIWAFIWISPQIYYFYYIQIIDNLPLQNVIQFPPSIIELFQTLTFTGQSNLSNHSKGILFWAMVIIALNKKAKS